MSVIKILPLIKPVKKTITIPGSKSYTNRALILATLTEKKVRIKNPLFSDDTKAMISCLSKLGIKIVTSKNKIVVSGSFKDIKDKKYILNANLSGTTIRFILALCCIVPGIKILQGEKGLNKRPIGDLVDVLRQLGAGIDYLDKNGFSPLKITTSKLKLGKVSINGEISSQFLSALLMILPIIGNVTINVVGAQISKSYVDMTINSIEQFGVKIINKNYKKYKVCGNQEYNIEEYNVEGDYSGAGYFAAIAALTKSKITIKNLNPKSIQGDREFLEFLKQMGNEIILGKNEMTIIGKSVKPVKINMENCPDQVQTLAVLAAFANGTTIINGVRSLRVKETERVKSLEQELAKMGIKTESNHDTLTIYGGDPKPAEINTYGDHRMAMSFAVAGTKLDGVIINNPNVVSKTFPDFWINLKKIGVKIKKI